MKRGERGEVERGGSTLPLAQTKPSYTNIHPCPVFIVSYRGRIRESRHRIADRPLTAVWHGA